jgi:hypothetical protein
MLVGWIRLMMSVLLSADVVSLLVWPERACEKPLSPEFAG